MSILLEVPGTMLHMTEYKMTDITVAHVLQPLISEDDEKKKEYRHDAVLRIVDLNTDAMLMEAKPDPKGSNADLKKLGLVLSNMILGMRGAFTRIKVDWVAS